MKKDNHKAVICFNANGCTSPQSTEQTCSHSMSTIISQTRRLIIIVRLTGENNRKSLLWLHMQDFREDKMNPNYQRSVQSFSYILHINNKSILITNTTYCSAMVLPKVRTYLIFGLLLYWGSTPLVNSLIANILSATNVLQMSCRS